MVERLHASCALVGERAILVRGPSGSGKSSLVLSLITRPPIVAGRPRLARLVADDQVLVENRDGRLLARPHPTLAGLLEVRGLGIHRFPHEAPVVVGLVVDREAGQRLPDVDQTDVLIQGVKVPRIRLHPDDPDPISRLIPLYLA